MFGSTRSIASPFFVAADQGDWFDGASWSGGLAPTAADAVVIDNGAIAVTSSASAFYPGSGSDVEAQSLAVGSRLDALRPADASGALNLADVDLSLAGELFVGVVGAPDDVASDVSGSLLVAGGGQTPGNVVSGGGVRVGVAGMFGVFGSGPFGGSGSTATGSLVAAGDLEVQDGDSSGSRLIVGATLLAARADGRVEVGGDLLGFEFIDVGVAADSGSAVDEEGGAVAVGELDVAGKIGAAHVDLLLPAVLTVGATGDSQLSSPASVAIGNAVIGEIDARAVAVGIASSGTAAGSLAIGTGDIAFTNVGISRDGDAQGVLTTGGGIGSAAIGLNEGGEGDASGFVTAASATSALVGVVYSNGSARGSLDVGTVQGEEIQPGIKVGYTTSGSGTAEGQMIVRSGIETGSIEIGSVGGIFAHSTEADGTVSGVLESFGDVAAGSATIGFTSEGSTGHADGTWIVHDGTFTSRFLNVGLNEGTGSATGRLHLDRALGDVDGLILGDGATLEIEIQGLLRGVEYSAIDVAEAARLDGVLAVAFVGPAQLGAYDLIVSAALGGVGITGDFDAVSISGLAAGQEAFWGIETTAIGDDSVEVFRLHVVPEPGAAALLALGLLMLGRTPPTAGARQSTALRSTSTRKSPRIQSRPTSSL